MHKHRTVLLVDDDESLRESLDKIIERAGHTCFVAENGLQALNMLRKRESANPSVIVDNFVQAMAHVWGAGGTDATPLFARWAATMGRRISQRGS